MKIHEIQAKSIIVPSRLPGTDFVINPYTGCEFGCLYCYATYTGNYVREPRSNWGNYLYVKANAVELVKAELQGWPKDKLGLSILLSSVTDPYVGAEQKYLITRGILEVFVDNNYPGGIGILTKSPLVLRDIDLLKQLKKVNIGLTITTTDDSLSRFLEVKAPLASRRFETLRRLNENNLPTYVFVGPLLPHFRYHPELLDELFGEIAKAGTKEVFVEHINLPAYIKERLWPGLRGQPEQIRAVYDSASSLEHREALDQIVNELISKYNLNIRLGGAIYHPDLAESSNKADKGDIGKKKSAGDIRQMINDAMSSKSTVRITYSDSTGNVTERVIAPLEWNDFDERKIRAYCYLRKDERSFVVSKIISAEPAGPLMDYSER